MAIEFERLITYFDADTKPLEAGAQRADRIVSALEKKFKSFKADLQLKITDSQASRVVGNLQDKLNNLNTNIKLQLTAPGLTGGSASGAIAGIQQQLKGVSNTFNQAVRDFSAGGLDKASNMLAESLKKATDQGQSAEETFRRFAPEINKLASALKRGSADQGDYNRRFADLPPIIQRAISETRSFGKSIQEAGAAAKSSSLFSGSAFKGGLIGGLIGGALPAAIAEVKQLASEGVRLSMSLDKLVRFTSTLDSSFQTPAALKQFTKDIEDLSTQIPQDAESIAQASFTIKSAFQDMSEPQLVEFLRQFGIAATASNTDIASHAQNVAALAKQYQISLPELGKFNALLASSYGQALARDSEVAKGFNQILNAAKATHQPLEVLIGSMSTLQGASNDAAGNTTLLLNVLSKLSDQKYIEGFKEMGISVYDANGQFKDLNTIINEVARAIDGLSDSDVNQKFEFLKDIQARQGFLALARNVQAFNKQVADGADLEQYANKTNIMLNSTEARWKMFWSNVQNGQRDFGNTISDYLLSIFDQATVGSQIEAFFGNLSLLMQKGISGLANSFYSAAGNLGLSVWSLLGGDPAEIEKKRQALSQQFGEAMTYYDEKRKQFNQTLKQEDLNYFGSIIRSPDASPQLKEWAQKQWNALQGGLRDGATQTTAVVKQTGNELKTSLDGLANNAAISPELRAKLKDEAKKIGDSVKQGVDEAKPAIAASAKDLQDALSKLLGDSRVSGGLKDSIRKELAGLSKAVADNKPEMNKAGSLLSTDLSTGFLNGIQQARPKVISGIGSLLAPQNEQAQKNGSILGTNYSSGFQAALVSSKPQVLSATFSMINSGAVASRARSEGSKIGSDLVQGLLQGMNSRFGDVKSMSNLLGTTAEKSTRDSVKSKSPSKVFMEIGKDVVQGFIDGIAAMRASANSALSNLLDLENIKGKIGKGSAAGVELLTSLVNEIARFNVVGKEQEVLLELTAGKYSKLNDEVRNRIILAAQEIDSAEKVQNSVDDLFGALSDWVDKKPSLDNLMQLFSDPKMTAEIEKRAAALGKTTEQLRQLLEVEMMGAALKGGPTKIEGMELGAGGRGTTPNLNNGLDDDAVQIFSGDAPRVRLEWETFFSSFLRGIGRIKQSLPSIKQSIGENLIDTLGQVGNVFANAVATWDGTARGFFKSLAAGFRDLVSQLIQQMIRLMIMKAVTNLLAGLGGSAAGSSAGPDLGSGAVSGGVATGTPGMAIGGMAFAGSPYIVGEKGPELFVPSSTGNVITNENTEKLMNQKREGDKINVNITQNFRGPRGMVAGKSSRQAAEGAALGVSRGMKGRRNS